MTTNQSLIDDAIRRLDAGAQLVTVDMGDSPSETLTIGINKGKLALRGGSVRSIDCFAPGSRGRLRKGGLYIDGTRITEGDPETGIGVRVVGLRSLIITAAVVSHCRQGVAVMNCASVYARGKIHDCNVGVRACGMFVGEGCDEVTIGAPDRSLLLENCGNEDHQTHSIYVDATVRMCTVWAKVGRLARCPNPVALRARHTSVRNIHFDVGVSTELIQFGCADARGTGEAQRDTNVTTVTGRAEAECVVGLRGHVKCRVNTHGVSVGGTRFIAAVTGEPGDAGWGDGVEVRCV